MAILNLKLQRDTFTTNSTIGKLFVNGEFNCFTLEDIHRPKKIMHETCIDAGIYEVVITYSQRFKKMMPLLLNVPNFTGIRIHSGNTDEDTSGCILVGLKKGVDIIGESRMAYDGLFDILNDFIASDPDNNTIILKIEG